MDSNFQNLMTTTLSMALKRVQEDNAIVSIKREDNNLKFKNKLGNEFEFELPKGEKGDRGLSIKGDKGDKGDQGDQGLKGDAGNPFDAIPDPKCYMNEVGHLIIEIFGKKFEFELPKGEKGDRGLSIKGDKGDKGDQGLKGDTGNPFDVIPDPKCYINKAGHLIIEIFGKKFDLGYIKSQGVKSVSGGGGGVKPFLYNNSAPMPASVGGFPEGTTFENTTLNSLWTGLLYNAERPVFTSFNINLSALIIEVGDAIASGLYQAVWSLTYPQFLITNSIRIDYINGSIVTNIENNMPNIVPASINIPTITFSAPTTISFKITAASTLDEEFSKSMSVSFYSRIYIGESTSAILDSTAIKALRISRLSDNINGDYQTESGGYKWFCFPVYMGQRLNFIDDATDLEVSMDDPKVVNVTNDFGVTQAYYAYRSYFVLNAALKIRVF